MKFLLTYLILAISLSAFSQSKISPNDLERAVGEWQGSLTYLDYQTGEPYTMPANLVVKPGGNEYGLILQYIYPNEPKANSSETIEMSSDGSKLNKHTVTSRQERDGQIEIHTEHMGKDNDKKALIRHIYIMGTNSFIMLKEVQFDASEGWIKRNEFSYKRKA